MFCKQLINWILLYYMNQKCLHLPYTGTILKKLNHTGTFKNIMTWLCLTIMFLQQSILLTIVTIDLSLRIFEYYVTRPLEAACLEVRLNLVSNSNLFHIPLRVIRHQAFLSDYYRDYRHLLGLEGASHLSCQQVILASFS